MINVYRLSVILVLALIISLSVFSISQLNLKNAYAQQELIDDGYDSSLDNDPSATDSFDNDQPRNPDPEFIEEIEPGEYNQSDDTTELDNNY